MNTPTLAVTPRVLNDAGILPIRDKPARFAIGHPNGLTSNSWKVWTKRKQLYIACRDNFREAKVSLHFTEHSAGRRWRMGFTGDAVKAKPSLLASPDQNRAWEIWDEPAESSPRTVTAFHLYFPTSELAVGPERRATGWEDVIFLEAGPPGRMMILSLFITTGDVTPVYESEPSFVLASFYLGGDRYAKLVAHADPEGNIHDRLTDFVSNARQQAALKGQTIPPDAFFYFYGACDGGARFLMGAKCRQTIPPQSS